MSVVGVTSGNIMHSKFRSGLDEKQRTSLGADCPTNLISISQTFVPEEKWKRWVLALGADCLVERTVNGSCPNAFSSSLPQIVLS